MSMSLDESKRLLPHQRYLLKRKQRKELKQQEKLDKLEKYLYQLGVKQPEKKPQEATDEEQLMESKEIDKLVEEKEHEEEESLKQELLTQQKYHQEQLTLAQQQSSPHDESLTRSKITNDFMFQIMHYETERQNGRTLNILVKYRYAIDSNQLDQSSLPNYIQVRQLILNDIVDYKKYPQDLFWEILSFSIAKEVFLTYKLVGISLQIQVEPSFNISPVEPGVHGCITTIGDIDPWDNVVPYQPKPGIL